MENCKKINNFCYVCGIFTPKKNLTKSKVSKKKRQTFDRTISASFKNAYEAYYKRALIENVNWAPNSVCKSCYNGLMKWSKKDQLSMRYAVPMIWNDPVEHKSDKCYACMNTLERMNAKTAKKRKYVGTANVELPVRNSAEFRPPTPPIVAFDSDLEEGPTFQSAISAETETYSLYTPEGPIHSKNPILVKQERLDFIVSRLELSQRKSEELASFLKENNLLATGTKVTAYRKRQSVFQTFFTVNEEKNFAFCNDIGKLMERMEIEYKAEDWRLFIDSSSRSLKAVLLHKLNEKPSVPIAYSTDVKETYKKMKLILKSVKYKDHMRRICCDLKVVAILCGMQLGYTKFMCFLCKWDSRNRANQYRNHTWELRPVEEINYEYPSDEENPGDDVKKDHNVIKKRLVHMEKIMLPYLHVKLGIVKSFLKTIVNNKQNPEQGHVIYSYLKEKFHISDGKIKEGT